MQQCTNLQINPNAPIHQFSPIHVKSVQIYCKLCRISQRTEKRIHRKIEKRTKVRKSKSFLLSEQDPLRRNPNFICLIGPKHSFHPLLLCIRPPQFFFQKLPQTPQSSLDQTVTGHQFSASSDLI